MTGVVQSGLLCFGVSAPYDGIIIFVLSSCVDTDISEVQIPFWGKLPNFYTALAKKKVGGGHNLMTGIHL